MVRHAPIRAADVTLDHDALEELIGERTRVVAFTLASNAVGSITDPARIAAAAHAAGALAWADGVHLAPHRRLRAREWGLDVLLCSPYKFFGPHLGVAAIRPRPGRVAAGRPRAPGRRRRPGTASRPARSRTRRWRAPSPRSTTCARWVTARSTSAFERIQAHEDGCRGASSTGSPDAVELYGVRGVEGRTPTFCFNVAGHSPRAVAERLGERGLYVWDGDYYALEPMRALGLSERGGAVRAGFLHYTTEEEVDRLLSELAPSALGAALLLLRAGRACSPRDSGRRLPGGRCRVPAGDVPGPGEDDVDLRARRAGCRRAS